MVKYIVGAVIVVLSWVLAIVIRFPLWIPTLITLLVALVLILLVGIEKLRERRAARALEKALAAQAASQAASARPDLQHEIEQMRAEFEKAVTALKGSKKAGKKALYTLPWYTIIGPPGCGKSTALRNSGLQFPYLSASGGGVRGLGGTRNCDWWMTSDAVILDTAGRWTTEDEDHEEWLGFLDLVKRFRPRKPLNGIIAAVSIGDVGGAREDDVGELARRIRERIDEVQERLHMSLPVYVVFTKCDLIPGFVETFDYMSKEDRSQMWGFTVPLSKKIAGPKEHFTERFDELLRALSKRAPKRMGDERKVANRELIYGFPQQLEVLKSNLEEFVHQLFLPNVFRETPLMRGVYLTSGTQEGRPIDRVMSRMAEAFGQPLVQLPEPKVESKSYFLRDMFAEVVFKDAEVAARSPEELKRQRLRTMLAAAIIFSFALGISGLPTVAWALNQSYLDETRERVDAARGNLRGSTEGGELLHPTALEPLRLRTEELAGYADDGPPVMMQLGMYQDSVFGPVQAEYLHALEERVILPLLLGDAHSMDGFARRFEAMGEIPQASEMRTMYERLKLHILLTRPSEENEPALDDANREFIQRRLVARWAEATNVRRGDDEYAMIEDNVAYFVAQLGSHPDLYQDRDVSTVTRMRAVFAAVEGFEMAVQGIIDEVERRNVPDLLLGQLVGRSPHNLQAREVVRGAFTRRGWEEHVNHMLEEDASRFFGEHWVLGTVPPANEREAQIEHEAQLAGLRSYFLHRYVEEWQDFIDSIHVVQPQTPQAHLEELVEFTSGEPQLITRLIRGIAYNVTLEGPEGAGGLDTSAAEARARDLAQRRAQTQLGRLGGMGTANAGNLMGVAGDRAQERLEQIGLANGLDPMSMTELGVRSYFEGLIEFAPLPPRDVPEGESEQVTPAHRYEEQLEFLRDALNFRLDGTNVTNFDERQATARSLTNDLIMERPDRWRFRLRTLLLPPIEGQAWVPPPDPNAPIPGATQTATVPTRPGAAGAPPTPPTTPPATSPPTAPPPTAPPPVAEERPRARPWWAH